MTLVKLNFFCVFLLVFANIGSTQSRHETTVQKLGTTFRFISYTEDSNLAAQTAQLAIKLIDSLNLVFSDYEEKSEITLLSQSAGTDTWVQVSDHLWRVLKIADRLSHDSNGAFDVTIGPLTKLWRRAFRRNIMPSKIDIKKALQLVGFKSIQFDNKTQAVRLSKTGMRIDLGGIAKGYIVDRIYNLYASKGLRKVLVDGGGDLFIGDAPSDTSSWKINLPSLIPFQDDRFTSQYALATSGDTFRYIESDGIRYSHIIDPRTGYGIQNQSNVTIIAETCMIADALASVLSMLTKKEVELLLKRYNFIILE